MKYKAGDIIVVVEIYAIGGVLEDQIKGYHELYQNQMAEIKLVSIAKSDKRRILISLKSDISETVGDLFEEEIRPATEREVFLYHILGPEALR